MTEDQDGVVVHPKTSLDPGEYFAFVRVFKEPWRLDWDDYYFTAYGGKFEKYFDTSDDDYEASDFLSSVAADYMRNDLQFSRVPLAKRPLL